MDKTGQDRARQGKPGKARKSGKLGQSAGATSSDLYDDLSLVQATVTFVLQQCVSKISVLNAESEK